MQQSLILFLIYIANCSDQNKMYYYAWQGPPLWVVKIVNFKCLPLTSVGSKPTGRCQILWCVEAIQLTLWKVGGSTLVPIHAWILQRWAGAQPGASSTNNSVKRVAIKPKLSALLKSINKQNKNMHDKFLQLKSIFGGGGEIHPYLIYHSIYLWRKQLRIVNSLCYNENVTCTSVWYNWCHYVSFSVAYSFYCWFLFVVEYILCMIIFIELAYMSFDSGDTKAFSLSFSSNTFIVARFCHMSFSI